MPTLCITSFRVPLIVAALTVFVGLVLPPVHAQTPDVQVVRVGTGLGYTGSKVNSVSFRTDPLATHGAEQFIAYYDDNADLIVAKRTIGTATWTVHNTGLTAAISDAHRVASLGVDGNGLVHLSWGHHRGPFNYVQGTFPGEVTVTGRLSMPGIDMDMSELTYPEYFYLPDGDLLYTYRLGVSGDGDTYIQRYDTQTRSWTLIQNPAILGSIPSTVNAYPNGIVRDSQDRLHWSWCWRRDSSGPDENFDQLYARSDDHGATWTKNDGTAYQMPITVATAEIVRPIPLGSYMGNHSHMAVDANDRPMIAQYYDPDGGGARLMLTWFDGTTWRDSEITGPTGWTRPLVLVDGYDRVLVLYKVGGTLRLGYASDPDRSVWTHVDMITSHYGNDPIFDRKRWEYGDGQVNVYYQKVSDSSVNVLEWDPSTFDPPTPPAAPSGLRANPGDGSVRLSWDRPYGAESFSLKRSAVSGGPYAQVATTAALEFEDTGVINSDTYYYVVSAINEAGEGLDSPQVLAVPQPTEIREPVADTYARSGIYANDVHGSEISIMAKNNLTDFSREAFVRFDVTGLELASSVLLKLRVTASGDEANATPLQYTFVNDDTWTEEQLTWNNRPSASNEILHERTGYANGNDVFVDVTSQARREAAGDGYLSLRIAAPLAGFAKIVHFGARERAAASARPQLISTGASGPRAPLVDTYARAGSFSQQNFGTEDRILVKESTAETTREAFLRFDVSGLTQADDVQLRLMPIATGTDGASTELTYELVDDDLWRETSVTWDARPSGSSRVLAIVTGYATGVPTTIDITDVVREEAARDGLLSLRISSSLAGGGRIVHFGSRENAVYDNQPRLDVTVTGAPTPGSVGTTLSVSPSASTDDLQLSWSASCQIGDWNYGIYEGTLGSFQSHEAVDCHDDGSDRSEIVTPGAGHRYFMVVPSSASAEGSAGLDSLGIERGLPGATCRPAQVIDACP